MSLPSSGLPPRPPVVVVLAAGQGTRMKSPVPKVLQPLCGRPMLGWVLDQARGLDPARILLVVSPGGEAVLDGLEAAGELPRGRDELTVVVQEQQRGTGDAVRSCIPHLVGDPDAPVVVLYGDMPALGVATLERLRALQPEGGLALLTAVPPDPMAFGRIVRDGGGRVVGIVEERDASVDQRAIREVNAGVYCLAAGLLVDCLARLSDDNAQGELYLTDVVADVAGRGLGVEALVADDHREIQGVNTLSQLARARAIVQERLLEQHLAAGVRIEDPATTTIEYGVEIGAGTTIFASTVVRRGVVIGTDCEVGPFTHLRVGSVLEQGAQVGNFTETKNARLGAGAKAKHLSYLGDVEIGARSNIGAGTIVANYDGAKKHPTRIGERVFIGSGSVLVAPSEIGAGSLTGAGAIVPRGTVVPPGEIWVGVPARYLKDR
ncbi:Bifunctional protein GlmU [Planctomycetes bacterium Pla163]|uniref:Bifunctional protein GlmU n=1 Tax=Rohdeia mirabilis TaxID=2528008 RepID=A0A518D329_9BACT|nr:Bifunctional protein GlmU [Planctomycetes bacterium Pla163]